MCGVLSSVALLTMYRSSRVDIPARIAGNVPFDVGFRLADAQLAFNTILEFPKRCSMPVSVFKFQHVFQVV